MITMTEPYDESFCLRLQALIDEAGRNGVAVIAEFMPEGGGGAVDNYIQTRQTTVYKGGEGFCPKCGKPYIYVGDWREGWPIPWCTCSEVEPGDYSPAMQGWICPRCGRVYAPWIAVCGTCGPGLVTTDSTNGTPAP